MPSARAASGEEFFMAKRWNRVRRGACAVMASGVLLQAGTCTLNAQEIAQGFVTAVAQNFITTWVFAAFGIPVSGGF
jgi:hypothetical protein